jgi:hypothetical protein
MMRTGRKLQELPGWRSALTEVVDAPTGYRFVQCNTAIERIAGVDL